MVSKQRWVYSLVAFFLACEPRIDVGVADAGMTDAGTQVRTEDGGIRDAGPTTKPEDAGIPEGGDAKLSGSRSFLPKTVRVSGFKLLDGGIDESRLVVYISDIELPCWKGEQYAGPGTAIVLDADPEPGVIAEGSFSSNGSNMYLAMLAYDGGLPNFEYIARDSGSFIINREADITLGVTGSLDLKTSAGETINGTFRASYCPPP